MNPRLMSRSSSITSDRPLGGRYKVLSQLGVGGFGRTFLAEDLHLPGNPQCVVKQLKPQVTSDDTMQTARRCFNTEAEVLYQLGNHDQIPRLLAHFEDQQEFYLALEFVEGEPLTQELTDGQPWPESRVIAMLKDVLEILVFVHEQKVIHRDLKPSNLIRRKHDGRIVLIDFGAVKQVSRQNFDEETGLTTLTISIGTQGYMPNEQLAGRPRFSSDLYALGIIGIQALTGTAPKYLGEDADGEVDWFYRAAKTSPELVEVLNRMVRYDFRERYQSAVEAIAALEHLSSSITDPPEAEFPHEELALPLVSATAEPEPCLDEVAQLCVVPDTIADVVRAELRTELEPIAIPAPLPVEVQESVNGGEAKRAEVGSASTTLYLVTEAQTPIAPSPSPTLETTGVTQAIGRPLSPNRDTTLVVRPKPPAPRWLIQLCSILAIGSVAGATFSIVRFLPEFLGEPGHDPVAQQLPPVTSTPRPRRSPAPTPQPISPGEQAAELVKQGDRLLQSRLYGDALKLFDRAIALKSDFAEAHAGRCEALNGLQRPEDAIVSCDDALAYKRGYPEALWSKGNAFLLQNRTMEALRLYEQVTQVKPGFAPGWVKRGVALQRLGRSAEALTMLDRSIGLERNSAEAWLTRSQALVNLGRYNHAIASLDKALQLEPDNATAKKLRQQLKDKLGR